MEELYETDISEKAWIVYDILGNIGWIVYGIGFGFLIVKSTGTWKGDSWLLLFLFLEGICAVGIVIGLAELINERNNKLDRVLTKTRLFRGFGSITYASLAAGIVSMLMLIISLTLNLKSDIHLLLLMVVGAALCYWFCRLLLKRYKKVMTDIEKVEQKRQKEQRVVEEMVMLYCKNHHAEYTKGHLCTECQEIADYAKARSENCPFMEQKTFCANCKVHCYKPAMREQIRKIMRYSGPRMLYTHPGMALWHLICNMKEKKGNKNT